MKTYILTMLLAGSFAIYSFGQLPLGYSLRTNIDLYNSNQATSGGINKILTETDIEGAPFLNDEFIEGSLYIVQKIQYIEDPLRYNIYNDNLEFKIPAEEIQALATPEIVERAVIGETQMAYSPYLQANKTKKGFSIVLEEGKISLYAKTEIMFNPATKPGACKEPEPPKFIKKSDEYYLRVGTGQARLISNKKDLIAAFPDNQYKMESFISKNKIKTNKPEGLKELVVYYNSL